MSRVSRGRQDYFSILGLENGTVKGEIKRAYRQLAKKYHPDINPSPDAHDKFIEITEAYEILMNSDVQVYYVDQETEMDAETLRAEYEKLRREARENARRYARMKYEKFQQEQEAFKKKWLA